MKTTRFQPALLGAMVPMCLLLACSVLNREGPTETCADLNNGQSNACREGIIASCVGGTMSYEVCGDDKACDATWQKAGQYHCDQVASPGGSGGSGGTSGTGGGTQTCDGGRYVILGTTGSACDDPSGLVKDTSTGLTWMRLAHFSSAPDIQTQAQAASYCQGRGMRMPTKDEALGIAGSNYSSCAFCEWETWTSTPASSGKMWIVSSNGAPPFELDVSENGRILCLR